MPSLTCYTHGTGAIDGCTLSRTRGRQPGPAGTVAPPAQPTPDSTSRYQSRTTASADAVKQIQDVKKTAAVSPLLDAKPITLTADILGDMVDTSKIKDVDGTVKNLNTTITLAKLPSALAEAMLLAQMIEETGGFINAATTESADGTVVYNARTDVPAVSKHKVPISGRMERYLQGPLVTAWRLSHAAYAKAQAAYLKANPGQDFDASGAWQIKKLTDYVPGDETLPYWKKWYDPESPDLRRAAFAKSKPNGNVNPGDGHTFIGRGYIQLTWRANYKAAGEFIGQDLIGKPALAADPQNAAKITAWFWTQSACNRKATADTDAAFLSVSRAVNGGGKKSTPVNMPRRRAAFAKAKAALLKQVPAAQPS